MDHATRRLALLAFVLLATGCASNSPAPRPDVTGLTDAQRTRILGNMAVFDRAWSLVNRKYFDAAFGSIDWNAAAVEHGPLSARAPDTRSLYFALNNMLGLLGDEHTRAIDPASVREIRSDRRVRNGFTQARIEGRWIVTEVLEGSPADAAGLRTGWIVISRNGVPIGEGMDLRAEPGEIVQWEFLDTDNRTVKLNLEARLLSIAPVRESRMLPGGVLYLRFDEFGMGGWLWLRRQLRSHRSAPALVLDLRRNGGGHVVALSLALGEFFGRSVNLGRFSHQTRAGWNIRSVRLGFSHYEGLVAVLTSEASASAAEIFAAAMQDHRRAVVVGEPTAGSVLGSFFHSLPDGGWLQVSKYDFVTPSGFRLEGKGISPDVAAVPTLAELRAGGDPVLEAAVRILRQP